MDVSIIMPVFQNLDLNKESVANLLRTDVSFELIVIDNGSTDGTAEFLATQPIRVITNPENVGISPAIEQGFAAAEGEFMAFTCNDMIVHPTAFGRMIQVMREDPEVYCVCPEFTDIEMPRGWWAKAKRMAEEPVKWKIIGPPMPPHPPDDQMMGGCWVVSRKGWAEFGHLDPELPDWYGDPDIWCRFRAMGHPVVQCNALIHHYQSMTTARVPGIKTSYSFHAQKVFESKWGKVADVIADYNANPRM
jgi:GT2 family glycosyltransferase